MTAGSIGAVAGVARTGRSVQRRRSAIFRPTEPPKGEGAIRRFRRLVTTWVALLAFGSALAGPMLVAAQTAEDPSNVVLVFDVSNSILLSEDGANVEFASALEGIADRVNESAEELVIGNSTISFVAFGRTAISYPPGCEQLALNDDPAAVAQLETCLRDIAAEYRAGAEAPVRQAINTANTDHVAALVEAADLLPDVATRSAVIFFTDGAHDPPGTARDNEDVVARIANAYEGRSPLAILPVGLGAGAGAFESDLQAIYDAYFRDMEPCEGRTAFSWPEVIFPSAVDAGVAVAEALQEVTCSFTFVPTPTGGPSPTPAPTPTAAPLPGDPLGVQLLAGDRSITVQWLAPTENPDAITGYLVRCTSESGGGVHDAETPADVTQAVISGLEPGDSYVCEVAATDGVTPGSYVAAAAPITVLGIPVTPGQPRAEPVDSGARLTVDAVTGGAPVEQYIYECSDAAGQKTQGAGPLPEVVVSGLVNGANYTCVAFAENRIGRSPASVASASFRPCSGLFACNPIAGFGIAAAGILGLLVAAVIVARRYRARNRVWVTAQVDGGENRSLGWGPELGIELEREDQGAWFATIRPFDGSRIRVQYRGSARFIINGGAGIKDVHQGDPAPVRDGEGNVHQLILRRYRSKPKERGAAAPAPPKPRRKPVGPEVTAPQELEARIVGRDDAALKGDTERTTMIGTAGAATLPAAATTTDAMPPDATSVSDAPQTEESTNRDR